MSTIEASHGTDTHVRLSNRKKSFAGGNAVRLQLGERRGFVDIPVTDIRGRTVLSATLTGHVRAGFVAQTVFVSALVDSIPAGKITWNRQPAIGASVSTALGSLADGDAANLDVGALMQAVANGAKWRGFRVTSDATVAETSNWYAFDSPKPSWKLTIELSDAAEQPSDLRPNIGAVASSAPILAWSFTDLGGDSSEQGSFRVQVDPGADETTPAFDTGWVTLGDPECDLSATPFATGSGDTFTPLALHAATQWRVMTKDAAGNPSSWSDWAPFSYEPDPTLVMDSPTGGVIGDSTPDVVAHMTGETLTQWRVFVEDAAGNRLWDSGLSDGPIDLTVPKRNDDGERVIHRDDASYDVVVRAWGDIDRAVAVGHPAYVEHRTTVVFDDDAGVITPGGFTVVANAPGDPRTKFTWTRTEAPDAVQILDDGEVFARLDSDDWTLDAGVYTWTDNGLAQPYVAHHFTIRAIESGVRSHPSSVVSYTSKPEGVWLIPIDDDPVVFDGTVTPFVTADRRATYKPININEDVDIVYGLEGVSGHFDGSIDEAPDRNVLHSLKVLERLRKDVYATPQMVWATRSIPVTIRNLSPMPDGENFNNDTLAHIVSWDFSQAGD